MNLTNVTINVSRNVKKTLTPEEQKQNEFMKMSPAKKWEFIYEMLMDHEDRISALESDIEPEPTPDPEPTPEPPTMEANKTFKFNIQGIEGTYNFITTGDVKALDEDADNIDWLFGVNLISVPNGLTYNMDEQSPIDTTKTHYISQKSFDGQSGKNIYYFNENDEIMGVTNGLSQVLIDNVTEQSLMEAGRKFKFEIQNNDGRVVGSFEFRTNGDVTKLRTAITQVGENAHDIEWLYGGGLYIHELTNELTDEDGTSIRYSLGSTTYYISKRIFDDEENVGVIYYADENSKIMKKIKMNNGSELVDALIILKGEVA